MSAENNQSGAYGGSHQCSPSEAIKTFSGKDGCGNTEQNRHGADHQGCVADGGARQSVELDEELDRDAEGGAK